MSETTTPIAPEAGITDLININQQQVAEMLMVNFLDHYECFIGGSRRFGYNSPHRIADVDIFMIEPPYLLGSSPIDLWLLKHNLNLEKESTEYDEAASDRFTGTVLGVRLDLHVFRDYAKERYNLLKIEHENLSAWLNGQPMVKDLVASFKSNGTMRGSIIYRTLVNMMALDLGNSMEYFGVHTSFRHMWAWKDSVALLDEQLVEDKTEDA